MWLTTTDEHRILNAQRVRLPSLATLAITPWVLLTLDLEDRWPILDDPQPMVAESIGKEFDEAINFSQRQS